VYRVDQVESTEGIERRAAARPHRMRSMKRGLLLHTQRDLSVALCVCVSVGHDRELWQNG